MKKLKRLIAFLFTMLLCISFQTSFAAKTSLPILKDEDGCTHTVYEDDNPAKYHYTYCKTCGKCNERSTYHPFTYSKYSSTYHKATCSCGYTTYKYHTSSAYQLKNGENVNGTVYSGNDDLDTYHKTKCTLCSEITGVEKHTWSGGNTTAHKCSGCGRVHSKKDDATQGLHYFDIEKIRKAGEVAACKVCNKYLTLTYSSDSILAELPKKEEYTMIGNPEPMEEMTLEKDQIIEVNFMPINEDGELIPLEELFLKVRAYTNGNYYSHYAKLIGEELSQITDRVKYIEDSETIDYIVTELSSMGALGGYNEEKKQEILDNVTQMVADDPNLTHADLYAITTVASKLGDFAINAINNPLLDWFEKDLAIKNTWLSGGTTTLRHDFEGSMTSSSGRKFTIYFSELPDSKYEILRSPILTHGIDFSTFGYSVGGYTNLMYSTLFTKGQGSSEPPANILAYVSIAYRDTQGNVIYKKDGNLATPKDTVISNVVYSGTSAHSVTKTINASMDWTQLSGYRYKGYLLKYGNNNAGLYSVYNRPSEMTVTTSSSVSVTSSFSTQGLRN